MFQRYGLILQYEMRPILPPPFIIITHIYLALKYIKRRCKGKRNFHDNGLSKSFINDLVLDMFQNIAFVFNSLTAGFMNTLCQS